MRQNIVAVIGAGGMGLAVARRLACGRRVLLADFSRQNLDKAANVLTDAGHSVDTHIVDVADFDSVKGFAKACSSKQGRLESVVHTAGLSPAMAPARRIYEVDLVGTAHVIEAFQDLMLPGTSMTCISSIARLMTTMRGGVSQDLEQHLRTAPPAELLKRKEFEPDETPPAMAYALSKHANVVRVQAAARKFAANGARINSISPGVIITEMIRKELESDSRADIMDMIEKNPMGRAGTADEIANVVAFLAGREASYINGTDIVVDGGQMSGGM